MSKEPIKFKVSREYPDVIGDAYHGQVGDYSEAISEIEDSNGSPRGSFFAEVLNEIPGVKASAACLVTEMGSSTEDIGKFAADLINGSGKQLWIHETKYEIRVMRVDTELTPEKVAAKIPEAVKTVAAKHGLEFPGPEL